MVGKVASFLVEPCCHNELLQLVENKVRMAVLLQARVDVAGVHQVLHSKKSEAARMAAAMHYNLGLDQGIDSARIGLLK